MEREDQVKAFEDLWQRVLLSNRLCVCTERLKGVTVLDVNIMQVVLDHPDVILREVGKVLETACSTLTSAVNRLENRGLLNRVISNRDLRSFGLELTDEGRAAVLEYREAKKRVIACVLDTLDNDEEREQFLLLVQKIVNKL